MIALRNAVFRQGKVSCGPLSFALPSGVTAFVGAPADGGEVALCGLGERILRSGSIHLGDRALEASDVAFVGPEAPLPDALLARECLDLGAIARKITRQDGTALLERFGLGALSGRRVEKLTRGERRAVALVDALTSQRRVIVLVDPLSFVAQEAAPAVLHALREFRGGDAWVLTSVSSPGIAADYASTIVMLDRGRAFAPTAVGRPALASQGAGRVRIVTREPMNLLRELAREGLATEAEAGNILVTGASLAAIAKAVQHAIVRAGVDVTSVATDSVSAADVRAAMAGDERAASDTAYAAPSTQVAAAEVASGAPGGTA